MIILTIAEDSHGDEGKDAVMTSATRVSRVQAQFKVAQLADYGVAFIYIYI
jgi:hypothetical protein